MLHCVGPSRRTSYLARWRRALHTLPSRLSPVTARNKPAPATTPAYASRRAAYPERILIYHAGTGRTVLIGCLKVTTIFIFSFFCLVVAPAHWYADHEPPWVAVAVVLSGTVPLIFVSYFSAPFVNYIHLRLPAFARNSRELLMRYSKSLPKDAEVDITTMNFLGKPRLSRLKVSDLRPGKERFGLGNYARNTAEINTKRPWWMGKAVRLFGVYGNSENVRETDIWEHVAAAISKRHA